MDTHRRVLLVPLALLLLAAACGPPGRQGGGAATGPEERRATAPKRLTVAIQSDPPTLSDSLNPAFVRGSDELEVLVNVGLAVVDRSGALRPRLAVDLPTVENGLWRVLPDGRMETTWRIRPNALWHDGAPFTSADLAFTATIGQDKELPLFGHVGYGVLDRVEAPDPSTAVAIWKRPYIEADTLFTSRFGTPLPKHLLAKNYAENKAAFPQLPYWAQEFVGTGPYRVRAWVASSHVSLVANDRYVLGRPRIDEIEVRFIPDGNTLVANLLAGPVEMTLGRSLSLEQAIQVRDLWREGTMDVAPANWILIYPQFINANPPVVAEAQFRRALLHAINRQELVDSLQAGLTSVAHSYVSPNEPEYVEIEGAVVRYDHDLRRALQLIEELGYTRSADGAARDTAGQALSVEIRTTAEDDLRQKVLFAVVADWQRMGIGVEPVLVPPQLAQNREYRATFPAFELQRNPNGPRSVGDLHSSQARLPENRFGGRNNARHMNPEFDALIDRYLTTIPRIERVIVLGQIVRHVSDQLTMMGLFYSTEPILIGPRVMNVTARKVGSTHAWNAHEWDVR